MVRIANWKPAMFVYVPDFITASEEALLLAKVTAAPQPKWITLSGRRVQNWGCSPSVKSTALFEPLPDWLENLANSIAAKYPDDIPSTPNHCLVNEYRPGQGIMPHFDGPAYKSFVATVSLGAHTILELYKSSQGGTDTEAPPGPPNQPDCRILLQPRSLVILKAEAYENYLHGISEVTQDIVSSATINNWKETGIGEAEQIFTRSATRVSLTFREAAKVSKLKLFGKKRV
ncbi:hypothetical protein HDU83_001548 [Entophlyctis luteolus]|nr:hypothetical protein HDU83_001548 [Entophlyctis luteolus]